MKRYLYSAVMCSAILALLSYAASKRSNAENNNVQIDMSVMQALNSYYDDEPDDPNDNTQVIKQPDQPVATQKPQLAAPIPPADNKTKKIKQLLSFEQKDLPELSNVPLPERKPQEIVDKAEDVMSIAGQTRKTQEADMTKDVQKLLPADDSGITMPAVPAASIAAESIEPAGSLSQDDLDANPSAASQEMAEKQHLNGQPAFIDITAKSGTSEEMPRAPEMLDDIKPQVLKHDEIAANPENSITLTYDLGEDEVSNDHKSLIDEQVLGKLSSDENTRLQIISYASSTKPDISNARRISLARALAIRSYLLANGIQANRMDVRALGNETALAPKDRIDIVFLPQASKT